MTNVIIPSITMSNHLPVNSVFPCYFYWKQILIHIENCSINGSWPLQLGWKTTLILETELSFLIWVDLNLPIWGGTYLFVDCRFSYHFGCKTINYIDCWSNMLHNIFVDVDQKHIIVVDLLIRNTAKAV